jgi:hypothetical protein
MAKEVLGALIAAAAQVAAALFALFGVLLTADSSSSAAGSAVTTRDSQGSSASDEACAVVVARYRTLVAGNPQMVKALLMEDSSGVSPLLADADARRCAITEQTLDALR